MGQWLCFLPSCQPVRAGGLSWGGRGMVVPHHCQLRTRHGWEAGDVAGFILSLGTRLSPSHQGVLDEQHGTETPMAETDTSIHLLYTLRAPNSSQHHLANMDKSPVPGVTPSPVVLLHCPGASCLLLQRWSHRCSSNIRVTPAHICLFQVSELQSHRPAFRLIISSQALKTEFYFYCNDPVALPDPSVEEM